MHTAAARCCKFLRFFFLRTACYDCVHPISSTLWFSPWHPHRDVPYLKTFPCFPCRQRMSLHSPWSLYLFHWKRNLRFEAVDLWDNQAESSFTLWTGWGHALLREHLVQQDFQEMKNPLNSRCRNMEWTWCQARKGKARLWKDTLSNPSWKKQTSQFGSSLL